MTKGEINREVKAFKKKYSVTETSYESLMDSAEKLGYTVIERDPLVEDIDIERLIIALNIDKELFNNRGFTYLKGDYRLIFIDDRLSLDEKNIVLAHEIGHIVLGHVTHSLNLGQDVIEEHDANQFAAMLLDAGQTNKVLYITMTVVSFLILCAIVCMTIILRGNVPVQQAESETTEPTESTTTVAVTSESIKVEEASSEIFKPSVVPSAEGIVTEHQSIFDRSRLLETGDLINYATFQNGILTFDTERGPQYIIDLTEEVILGCTGSPARIISYKEQDGILSLNLFSNEFSTEYEYRFYLPGSETTDISSFELTGNMLILYLADGDTRSFNVENGKYLSGEREYFDCDMSLHEGLLEIKLTDTRTNDIKHYKIFIQ